MVGPNQNFKRRIKLLKLQQRQARWLAQGQSGTRAFTMLSSRNLCTWDQRLRLCSLAHCQCQANPVQDLTRCGAQTHSLAGRLPSHVERALAQASVQWWACSFRFRHRACHMYGRRRDAGRQPRAVISGAASVRVERSARWEMHLVLIGGGPCVEWGG